MSGKIKCNFISVLVCISVQMFSTSYAHEIDLKEISIKHPMIPIFNSKMKTAAGYFTIINKRNKTGVKKQVLVIDNLSTGGVLIKLNCFNPDRDN